MASFVKLPCEMMSEILSFLPLGDLASMALVSHQVHHVALPLLYKAPYLGYHGRRTKRQCFNIFLWTILTPGRESLATHVRSLTWHTDFHRSRRHIHCPSEYSLIAPAATRVGMRRTMHGHCSKFVLLLHLLPHLQVLDMNCILRRSSFTAFMDSLYTGLALPITATPVLGALREFHAPHGHARGGLNQKALMVLLALPCIRRIQACIVRAESSSVDTIQGRAASSSVTHLRLWDPSQAPYYLLAALSVPRALTHFSYCTMPNRDGFNLDLFWAAMRPLSASVVCLYLDLMLMGPAGDDQAGQFGTGESTRSLVEWTSLRTLSCSLEALMGERTARRVGGLARFLPRGLRRLEVVQDQHWGYGAVVEEMVELMARKDVVVPRLERVAARAEQRFDDVQARVDDVEARELLRGACEAAGVTVVESIPHPW